VGAGVDPQPTSAANNIRAKTNAKTCFILPSFV
jgi:hypothetical protein